ncbi:hypothetical protein FA048_16475 [Pedobacter polaris]|uniref:Uncharacterized protein n=1 Tax=Pedobacter polaris TaxID=2571273 RepID=A0A4U1CN46_9SPHI|nr:hypothetical protein [Pedobacter polaris]TKC06792.1 hypothetical protein FA048_16475 [Pedobacter polaris]
MSYNLFTEVSKVLKGKDKAINMPPVPKQVSDFLGKLGALEEVPMHNLIIDNKYLPLGRENNAEKGCIKLFALDPEWIECLINGALSLADENDQLILGEAMTGKYTAEFYYNEATEKVKKQIIGQYLPEKFEEELKNRLENNGVKYEDKTPTANQSNWKYTGFFIRSSIVSTWKGVEIIAYGKSDTTEKIDKKLQVVKLEQISYDIIYCICEGLIEKIEIIQPAETIHFDTSRIDIVKRSGNDGVLNISEIAKKNGFKDSAMLAEKLLAIPYKTELTIDRKIVKTWK